MKGRFIEVLRLALSYKSWMAFAALLGFLTVGSGIGLMMTSAYIIAKAALHPSIAELQIGIVGVRFFGIARGVFRYFERYVSHEVTFRILECLRVWFYKAVEPLAPARLQNYKSGDLLARIVADVETLEHVYVRIIAPPVVAVAVSVLMWFLFGIFDIRFSLTLLAFSLVGGTGVPALTRFLSQRTGNELIETRSQLSVMAIDATQGMQELLAFGRQEDHLAAFDALNKKYVHLQRRMALVSGLHESLVGLIMNAAVFVILTAAIPEVNSQQMEGVFLSVLVIGTMAAFEAVVPLPAAAQYFDNSMKAADRLFEIIETEPIVEDAKPELVLDANFHLSIRNLKFRYPANASLVLNDLSFDIPEKSKTVVVGASGAGKSTLINILMRFWEFQAGLIQFGSVDIRRIPQEALRRHIAVVSQNTHLFNNTIFENIRLANPAAPPQEVETCARLAQIHQFIAELPAGYNTWIGEQGLQLSAGQRQRLSIARALLKNTPVILFDEPTANLDVVTEKALLASIWPLAEEKTVVLFTHRLVDLENADRILVLQEGQIIESGKHSELLKNDGLYREMVMQQNQLLSFDFMP